MLTRRQLLERGAVGGAGLFFVLFQELSSLIRVVGIDVPYVADAVPTLEQLDTLLRIFESLAHNMGKIRNRAVDFWIKPDTSRFGLAEFHRTSEIAAAGEAAAHDAIPELKQRLIELEKRLLERPSPRA